MSTGTPTFSDAISYIIPAIISAVTSAIVSIISFLFTRHYVVSGNRRRIIRAIFNVIEVKDENKSFTLRRLYDSISALKLFKVILYISIYIFFSSPPLHNLIPFTDSLYFILISLTLYPFLYNTLYTEMFNESILSQLYKNNKKIKNIIEETIEGYNENQSRLVSYIFYFIYIIWVDEIYTNRVVLSIILILFLPIILWLILSLTRSSKLEYKTDLESLIFRNSGVTVKAKVHTTKDVIEGVITDIRDELVLFDGQKKIYITWDNILYFEIIDEKGKNNETREFTTEFTTKSHFM